MGYVTIPHNVSKLLTKKEGLRILRENVMLIVRDYNNIIHIISDKEKLLFKDGLHKPFFKVPGNINYQFSKL